VGEESGNHPEVIDACPDGADLAAALERLQRGESTAGIQLPKPLVHALLGLLMFEVEIVNRQPVHAVQPQPLETVLVGSGDAVGAVVETQVEGETAAPPRRPR
jgi:hypothetical protein